MLTVMAANKSRLFGMPNPTLTGTLAGVVSGDNITASYATTADASSPPGVYAITAALNDPSSQLSNYIVTNTPGTLTVLPAPVPVPPVPPAPPLPPPPSLPPAPLPKAPAVVSPGVVQVTDPVTRQTRTFTPFVGYAGDVRAAVADVTGDRVADIIVGTGQVRAHESFGRFVAQTYWRLPHP
jgi:hypothetical protein